MEQLMWFGDLTEVGVKVSEEGMIEDREVLLMQKFSMAEAEEEPFLDDLMELCHEHGVMLLGETTILASPSSRSPGGLL